MKRTAFRKAAISSLIVGTTMVGCTGAAFRPSAIAPRQQKNPDLLAGVAEKAASRDTTRTVQAAEAAVRSSPRDAGYRQRLGRAYAAAGRFVSAETALSDAMTLGDRNASTIVSLALVQVALGKDEAARRLLAANAANVPASDYGLAMTLAGDPAEGVRILSEVIHDPSATARTRQNLAYAYALSGRWKDARLMVGMDLEPSAANQRITQWAQTAAPGLAQQRVAALMGVRIDPTDLGQPIALALISDEASPVQMAEAAPVQQPGEARSGGNASFKAVAGEPAVVQPAHASMIQAITAPAPSALALASRRVPALSVRIQQGNQHSPVKAGGNWVVQLGAYDNAAVAREKWYAMARNNGVIASLPVVTSQITVKGSTFSRLAVSGFDSRSEATALCRSIRARHGQCFVRENVRNAIVQRWALTPRTPQFASR